MGRDGLNSWVRYGITRLSIILGSGQVSPCRHLESGPHPKSQESASLESHGDETRATAQQHGVMRKSDLLDPGLRGCWGRSTGTTLLKVA